MVFCEGKTRTVNPFRRVYQITLAAAPSGVGAQRCV